MQYLLLSFWDYELKFIWIVLLPTILSFLHELFPPYLFFLWYLSLSLNIWLFLDISDRKCIDEIVDWCVLIGWPAGCFFGSSKCQSLPVFSLGPFGFSGEGFFHLLCGSQAAGVWNWEGKDLGSLLPYGLWFDFPGPFDVPILEPPWFTYQTITPEQISGLLQVWGSVIGWL